MNTAGGWRKWLIWEGNGHLDHNMVKLMSIFFFFFGVGVCVCVNELVDNSEEKIVNNKLLKTTFENV